MAFKNKEISNPQTGQSIRFLQTSQETGGRLLEMESTFRAYSKQPPVHYHPYQSEDFTVVEGELTVRIDGKDKILQRGDTLHIAPNVEHAMWNQSLRKTVVNWKVRPALDTEYLLETSAGLASDGKTDRKGMPNILQVALLMRRYSDVFRITKPPYAVQQIVFGLLLPFSYLFGYRATYREYID